MEDILDERGVGVFHMLNDEIYTEYNTLCSKGGYCDSKSSPSKTFKQGCMGLE